MRATVAHGEEAAIAAPPQDQRNAHQHGGRQLVPWSDSLRMAGYQSL